jgi:branched-chain amino acid transport system permease protein
VSSGPYAEGFVSGLAQGGLYALVAFGYNLVYQSSRIFNFAQSDLLTLGGLFAFTLVSLHQWSPFAAIVPIIAAVALVGLVQERVPKPNVQP